MQGLDGAHRARVLAHVHEGELFHDGAAHDRAVGREESCQFLRRCIGPINVSHKYLHFAAAAAFPGAPHAPGPGGAQLPAQAQPLPAALHPRRAQRRLSGLSVLLLCCVFLLDTQPLVWVSLASGFSLPVPWGVQAASWLLCCALSALNPLLYTWRNEEFRRSVRSVLPGIGDAAAAAAAATAVPAVSQAQLGTRAAGQHW